MAPGTMEYRETMPTQDVLINEDKSAQGKRLLMVGETLNSQLRVQKEEGRFHSFSVPNIMVMRKFQDWCVLQLLSRGVEPRTLLQWVSTNGSNCFDFPEPVYSDSEMVIGEDDSSRRDREIDPVLANPHYSAYGRSLVLVARKPCVLKMLVDLRISVHCLIQGKHRPNSEIKCRSYIGGKEYQTNATCLDVVPSTRCGFISLMAAYNEPSKWNWIAPRQFRRHLKATGCPVLGNAKDARSFRGESLCLSTVRLEFLALGVGKKQCICIPPISRLRDLLEQEERTWREQRGQEGLRIDLFGKDAPKPQEYILEKAKFHDLEFRITPAVMIPRKGSESLVERVIAFYDKQNIYAPRPVVLDLGTGSGVLMVTVLHRLRHRNAIGVGVDVSREALELAEYNIAALGLKQSAKTVRGPFSKIHTLRYQPCNVVVCNPPYHPRDRKKFLDGHEPHEALFVDPADATVHYRDILNGLRDGKLVSRGAFIIFEVYQDNVEAVAGLMEQVGIENIQVGNDSLGCVRTIEGTFPGMLRREFKNH